MRFKAATEWKFEIGDRVVTAEGDKGTVIAQDYSAINPPMYRISHGHGNYFMENIETEHFDYELELENKNDK